MKLTVLAPFAALGVLAAPALAAPPVKPAPVVKAAPATHTTAKVVKTTTTKTVKK